MEDRPSAPSRVWNRIPAGIHDQIIELVLEQSKLSPRELAVRFTDGQRYFVSETYRTRNHTKADVFDYIERFYNPTRATRPWAISAPWTSSGKRR